VIAEELHPAICRGDFIEGMSRVAAAVSIVTTDGAAGRDGMAVTAMSPVSADTERPTLLICVKSTSRPAPVIRANGVFCVNVLAEEQAAYCELFAGRSGGSNDHWFNMGQWTRLYSGAPALDRALVNFDCSVSAINDVGTHHVIIGSVLAMRSAPGRPLLYANRGYRRLSD
jgi:flavin reductase